MSDAVNMYSTDKTTPAFLLVKIIQTTYAEHFLEKRISQNSWGDILANYLGILPHPPQIRSKLQVKNLFN